jgi:type IV pilus assembly protein PilX
MTSLNHSSIRTGCVATVAPTPASLYIKQQRGVVLFLALIAIVVMSLAAVALIRSVDTSTLIAGNLAFKQSATTSADAGIEAAIALLTVTRDSAANANKNVLSDATHTFNITSTATRPGYYSNADPALDLFAAATWDNDINNSNNNSVNSVLVGTDASGNKTRYVIQRMCRNANVAIQNADCLFSAGSEDASGQQIPLPQTICSGTGCPVAGQTPQIRITTRVTGPRNTVSYVQAFVY